MNAYNLIPLSVILLSLGTIIAIVVRKFSVLASLDVAAIQAEREAKFKEQLISARIKRSFYRHLSMFSQAFGPLGRGLAAFFQDIHKRLLEYKRETAAEAAPAAQEERRVSRLFAEARAHTTAERYGEAEQRYIEIIGLEPKNLTAFRELGDLYFVRKDFNEARETLEHALRLASAQPAPDETVTDAPADYRVATASIRADLAAASLALDDRTRADEHISAALAIEPSNPRYLDTKLQISIITKDKIAALDAYGKLKEANPENQKLGEFKAQIDEL